MIKLPIKIVQLLWSCGNNKVEHLNGYDKEFSEATFDIVSTSPFVIQANSAIILLTKDENDPNIETYQYVVLTNKKPRKSEFLKGNILSIRWIKHPKFTTLPPNEITTHGEENSFTKRKIFQIQSLGFELRSLEQYMRLCLKLKFIMAEI